MVNKKMFFVHIPKCGGTSFYEVLATRFGSGFSTFDSLKKYKNREVRFSDVQCLAGHFWFGVHQTLEVDINDCLYITIVRNPIDRVKSFYQHVLYYKPHYLHQYAKDGIRAFVEQLHQLKIDEIDNLQCKMISGGSCLAFDAIDSLKKNFYWYSSLEKLELNLKKLLGFDAALPKLNESSLRVDIEDECKELILSLNLEDMYLYEYVNKVA